MLSTRQKIRLAAPRSAGHSPARLAIVLAAILLAAGQACADEPKVTAVLTSSDTVLGRPVRLDIKVTGSPNADMPDVIQVDGLEIQRTGTSREFRMNGFNTSSAYVYSYTIMPERTGTFKIPPQTFRAGSNTLHTPELTLNVMDSGGRSAGSARPGQQVEERKLVFAELIIAKSTAYLGEMIPAEIRLGFNARARAALTDGPTLTGQGFTTQKFIKPQENIETIGGQTYDVLTYKTAIAAARTGRIELGPVNAKAVVAVPRRPSSSNRSPFDIFNMDDPFSDPFFNDPFGGFTERREIEIKSKPATLEVKPLPPNAPPTFSGAVGNFTMTADANPKSAQVGDPLTITTTISGRGNLDRVDAPALADESGWHTYPPSSKFKQDDDVGISGTKTFETVLTPSERKKEIPPVVFSYFDPLEEHYLTLRSDPIPVRIEGGAAATPPVVTSQPASAAPVPPGSATSAPAKTQDILYQITEWPGSTQSFTPVYERSNFWFAQIIPLIGLLGLLGWKWRQAKLGDREARRRADLEHEASELERRLRRSDRLPQEYYAEAARAIQIRTALAKNMNPNLVDANAAAVAFQLDEKARNRLQTLFQKKDELRYSGNETGTGSIPANQQREVLELIENLRA